MTSARELALQALAVKLEAAVSPAPFARQLTKPADAQDYGLAVQRDGVEAELIEETLSVRTWTWRLDASVELFVRIDEDVDWRAQRDALVLRVDAAIQADRTLGGAVDHAQPGAPQIVDEDVEGFEGWASAVVPIPLWYTTTNPTG